MSNDSPPTTALARRDAEVILREMVTLMAKYQERSEDGPKYLPSASALKNSVHVMGEPGSGKSRLLGRGFAWQAFQQRKPLVISDSTGGTTDNFLDKLIRMCMALPSEYRAHLWSRIRYIDVGATDYIVPKPLYFRRWETEPLMQAANRLLAIFKRQDPELTKAPVLGWNALYTCGIYGGMLAVALERPIDFVADLVSHPNNYKDELTQALAGYPELEPAVTYFRELMDPNNHQLRARRTESFTNKLIPFLTDPTMRATFSHTEQGIDWEEVEQESLVVILDYRNVYEEQKQFHQLWDFRDFTGYIEHRGMAGRGREMMFIVDELADLLGHRTSAGLSLLADDLNDLVTRLARNYGVNCVLAHQSLGQIEDTRIQKALMRMGTQFIGMVADPDERMYLARYFFKYDPFLIKERIPVRMSVSDPFQPETSHSYSQSSNWSAGWQDSTYGTTNGVTRHIKPAQVPQIVDYQNVYYTIDEQLQLLSQKFQSLGRFDFIARTAIAEGDLSGKPKLFNITPMDKDQYPNEEMLVKVRAFLRAESGIPIEELRPALDQSSLHALSDTASSAKKKRNRRKGKKPPHAILPNTGGSAHDQRDSDLQENAKREPYRPNFWNEESES